MCEYISFVASTEGALEIYAAPGLNSHGEARLGWGVVGGAECEWTGKGPESLAVRFEDEAVRKTVRAMILEKYATRKKLIHSITETRGANGYREWYKDGKLHRAGDKPAIEYADGSRAWYKDGLRHRDGDLPAVEWASGDREWWKNGKRHRAGDKPAIERADGYRFWYKDGKLHRAGDKPAIERADGYRAWYKDGKLHRAGDKPAIERADGYRAWYKNGVEYTPKSQ
jgi:uncharacterized protein CbrC (UPF0167 family)